MSDKKIEIAGYLYRIDTIETLRAVKKTGFKCGTSTRLGNNEETNAALKQGLKTPPAELNYAPRIYFFKTIDGARQDPLARTRLLVRFSRENPLLHDNNLYTDGAMKSNSGAVYAICKDYKPDDVVIDIDDIEVIAVKNWAQQSRFEEWINLRNWVESDVSHIYF